MSEVRNQNSAGSLLFSAFCFLPSAFCFLPSALRETNARIFQIG